MHPDLRPFTTRYSELLYRQLRFVLDRYRVIADYGFIDTKYHIVTETEFDPAVMGSPIYGRDIVYGYVQGRGLEALSRHLSWIQAESFLPAAEKDSIEKRILTVLREVSGNMEVLRRKNRGRVPFMARTDGTSLQVTDSLDVMPLEPASSTYSFSDLFYAKGLYTAGCALRERGLRAKALRLFRDILASIRNGTFDDRQPLLRPGPRPCSDKNSSGHGPRMIALGGAASLLRHSGRAEWYAAGAALLRHVARAHIHTGDVPGLELHDFVERVDGRRRPWQEDGHILCDPGHALEFVGLACSFMLTAERAHQTDALRKRHGARLARVAQHVFALGFNAGAGGIYKTVDLLTRRPINAEMPWWSLPETMRAAALLLALRPVREHQALLTIYRACHDALLQQYIRPGSYALACQTRDADGRVVDRIPAVPDVDPCYHIGLSLIDILQGPGTTTARCSAGR